MSAAEARLQLTIFELEDENSALREALALAYDEIDELRHHIEQLARLVVMADRKGNRRLAATAVRAHGEILLALAVGVFGGVASGAAQGWTSEPTVVNVPPPVVQIVQECNGIAEVLDPTAPVVTLPRTN